MFKSFVIACLSLSVLVLMALANRAYAQDATSDDSVEESNKPAISALVQPKHKKKNDGAVKQLTPDAKSTPLPEDGDEEGEKHYNDVYIVHFREYDELYHQCGLSECCRASINEIRKDLADPDFVSKTGEIKDCPDGMLQRSMPCPNSMTWCINKPKYQKRTFEARKGKSKAGAVGRLQEMELKKTQ